MKPLRKKMLDDMAVRGFSPSTCSTYLRAVAKLALFYKRSPDRLDRDDVQRFLLHMVQEQGLSRASVNTYAHGLRFFYGVTLRRRDLVLDIPRARQAKRLPEILSREEVTAIINAAAKPRDRALLATTYGAGLRASEVVRLQINHIDSTRMSLRIAQGTRCPMVPASASSRFRSWPVRSASWKTAVQSPSMHP